MKASRTVDIQTVIDRQSFGAFQWTVLGLCFLVMMLDGFDTAAIGYIAPAMLQDWHVPKSALGPVLSAALLGLAVGAILAGPLADRVGRKTMMAVSVAFFGAASLASSFSGSLEMLTALRFVTGLGLGAAMPNVATLTSEFAPAHRRALLTNAMFCGFPLGAAGGGLIAAWLIPHLGWRSVLLVGGLAPLVLALALSLWMPESLRYLVARRHPAGRIRAILQRMSREALPPDAVFVSGEAVERASSGAVRAVLSRPYLAGSVALWLAYFMGLVIFYLLTSWMPVLMKDVGFSIERATVVAALFPLGGVIGTIAVGWLMDRFDPHAVVAGAFALTGLLVLAIGQSTMSLGLLAAVVFVAGIPMSGALSGMPALAAQFYPTRCRATGVSWMMGIGRCGGIAGALVGTELMRRQLGFDLIFALAAAPAVVSVAALAVKRLGARAAAPASATAPAAP